MIDANEVKKDLYKSKGNAKFSYYCENNLYYIVRTCGSVYQFPIPIDPNDLGSTKFYAEMRASELNRWIQKAIEKEEFINLITNEI